jgi:arylformamidase
MGSHSSTHVDAQKHFMMQENSIDAEPLSKFIGESIVIDLSGKPNVGEGITLSDLEAHSRDIKDNDILKSLIPGNIG